LCRGGRGRARSVHARCREGVFVELIDLRILDIPGLDVETIGKSPKKTGAVVIAEEAAAS
jgi:pyruvate/2-oxoglutarate/acetoin dehydrogenase E1 component